MSKYQKVLKCSTFTQSKRSASVRGDRSGLNFHGATPLSHLQRLSNTLSTLTETCHSHTTDNHYPGAMSANLLLSLPLELREQIYSLYFKPADRLTHSEALNAQGFFGGVYRFDFDLCRVNKQIYAEAKAVWRRENVFVKIATPWPSAGMYRVYLMSEEDEMYEDEDWPGIGGNCESHKSVHGIKK
jgi:hypothetical protein